MCFSRVLVLVMLLALPSIVFSQALTPFNWGNSLDLADYCDGSDELSDNACIATWISDAHTQGKHLYASPGTYLYTSQKAMHQGFHLQCAGSETVVFKRVGNLGTFLVLSAAAGSTSAPWSDISIENCGFDMAGTTA